MSGFLSRRASHLSGMTQSSKELTIMWKLLAFRLLIGGIVAVYVPYSILSSYPEPAPLLLNALTIIGVFLITIGSGAYLHCVWDFAFIGQADNPNVVVASGTYKFVRNPMYVSLVIILLGEGLMFKSEKLLGYALGL
jgi:protein-S-isoprenylcysteine O-methyltransferase Ste14